MSRWFSCGLHVSPGERGSGPGGNEKAKEVDSGIEKYVREEVNKRPGKGLTRGGYGDVEYGLLARFCR